MTVLEHGLRATYARGCRCADCREANRNYRRIQRPSRRDGIEDQALDDIAIPFTQLPVRGDWRDIALCLELVNAGEADAAWWYEDGPGGHKYLKARPVCERCPVAEDCLQWAIDLPERFGLWGGKSPKERRAIARGRRRICEICDSTFQIAVQTARNGLFCSDHCRHEAKLRRQAQWHLRHSISAVDA